ncbi:MAG: RluA family pseudouridine synthase [Candidatus Zixiibacteriota bacterium]|nr:MAG: RluA family pseudouridine synthase [candidate division Zixibacteria bacterium]
MPAEFHELRLIINTHEPGVRLDRYLARQVGGISRTRLQALMEAGLITIGEAPVKPSHPAKYGEEVVIRIPGPEPSPMTAEDIPLEIFFEDEHLIVINKPPGLVVHPAHGHPSGTLVNALLHHCRDLGDIGGTVRPGLVHRLDKDTSGLLVVAKHERALAVLARQFKEKTAERTYRALVWGRLHPPEGRIEAPLGRSPRDRKLFGVVSGGKEAATRYRTVETFELFSLLELQLETGRTHQIRIHMQHVNHPVFGDSQYGGRNRRLGALTTAQRAFVARVLEALPRQALHAGVLGFQHPATGQYLRFESDLPADMKQVLELIREKGK